MNTRSHRHFWRALPWLGAVLMFCLAGAAFAQDEADPPARVGYLSLREGGVVFAPRGEDEWVELPQNRPLTVGDRVWTDRGARAELQIGSATLHVGGESHLGISDLDDRAAQFILQQGTVNVRVRDLTQGENFEVGTPNLAFRALQPGDYRIDVDAAGTTRVTVQSGTAALFGEGGQSLHLGAGQQAAFAGRFLAPAPTSAFRQDEFGLWAAERNRAEDQSLAARYVPRGVVGSAQLDAHGQWSQDSNLGAVWYPQVPVADWAPYRYGHWDWVQPWGWTWVDDAPWGFAPFHYGRWTMIGQRWAWVPGRLAARPVYSPALVVFLGGDGFDANIGAGPSVGWYPLAPGEAWWPVYRTTPRYVSFANFNINLNAYPRQFQNHFWRQRPNALTAVGREDFRGGRPVYRHWRPLQPNGLGGAQVGVVPARPDGRQRRDFNTQRLNAAPPAAVQPAVPQRFWVGRDGAVREQYRAQQEQLRLQRDAERAAREQQRQPWRQQQDPRGQREPVLREPQDGRSAGERSQREAWQQRQQVEQVQRQQVEQQQRQQVEQVQRQQVEQQQRRQIEQVQRQQQDRSQREAWQLRRQQEQVQRQQVEQVQRQQQDGSQRETWQRERGASRFEQPRVQQPVQPVLPVLPVLQPERVQPQVQQQQGAPIGRSPRERGEGRWQRGGDGEGRGR